MRQSPFHFSKSLKPPHVGMRLLYLVSFVSPSRQDNATPSSSVAKPAKDYRSSVVFIFMGEARTVSAFTINAIPRGGSQ
jgi:hypothetical protein